MERQGQRVERQSTARRAAERPRRDKGDRVERAEREQYYAKPAWRPHPIAATSSRIPIRRSPSSPRSSSSSSRARERAEWTFAEPRALDRQRIDKWLWHARMVRTRSDAAALGRKRACAAQRRRVTAPSQPVRVGDVVTVALDRAVRVLKVDGLLRAARGRARRPRALP